MGAASQAVVASANAMEPATPAQAVDEGAMRELYEAHAEPILRRLWRLTGDRARAEELCQDTFVIAFERMGSFRGQAKLSTWLHGIAFNLAREDVDRSRRRRGLLARFSRHAKPLAPASAPDVRVSHDELVGRLRDAIAGLSADQREAYVLRVIEQLSLEECAELLGVPVSTISYRARKAEERVRASFEAADKDENR